MENRLKPETTGIIDGLKHACIRTVMVTGDNMLTALSVARECHMVEQHDKVILVQAFPPQTDKSDNTISSPQIEYVYTDEVSQASDNNSPKQYIDDTKIKITTDTTEKYHFAVAGKSWAVLRQFFPDVIPKIVLKGTVFARMLPDQKAQLIESLQDLGYYVGMCGDGANDCGALKTAHAGISLSEAEASVASPFTSKTPNISCVPTVIREGRAALVTSFGIFKYMACYGLVEFMSVSLLYWYGLNLSDFEFLWCDLFILTTLSLTCARTEAYEHLTKYPPTVSLVDLAPILSLILQTSIMTGFQVFFNFFIQKDEWFVPFEYMPGGELYDYSSYENTAIFYSSMYQYIIMGIVFSRGKPYRKPFYTNYWFVGNLVVCVGVSLWINIYPGHAVANFFKVRTTVLFYRSSLMKNTFKGYNESDI